MNQHESASKQTPSQVVVVQQGRPWIVRILSIALMISIFFNVGLFSAFSQYTSKSTTIFERFHSGELTSSDKIARIVVDFTIMPPYTKRIVDVIDHVKEDDGVKGVLLVIDSPGGLVSDSHEIYHKLKQLAEKKPIVVCFRGIAASGGYYIAMGAGPEAQIIADPSTWTGSIGVILPRYDLTGLGEKFGIASDSLSTGELKDTLNPLKEMSEKERTVWNQILNESYEQFLAIIDEGRANLNLEQVRSLATGQIYTANQALANGLIDSIGYETDAIQALHTKLGLTTSRVVDYEQQKTLTETLLGVTARATSSDDLFTRLMNLNVPRAMYFFGWPNGLDTHSL